MRGLTDLPIEAHLMVEQPERQIEAFAAAGANCITIHLESTRHPHRVLQQIHERGCEAGITLNPGTPVAALEPMLAECDRVQIMSVNPGWGGQSFIPQALDRIREARERLDAAGRSDALGRRRRRRQRADDRRDRRRRRDLAGRRLRDLQQPRDGEGRSGPPAQRDRGRLTRAASGRSGRSCKPRRRSGAVPS